MKLFLFLLCFIYLAQTNAQELTGIWSGTFTSDNESLLNSYEVQIDNLGSMVKGVTYSYGGGANKFYLKFSLVGVYNPKNQKILFQEAVLLDHQRTSVSGVENFICYLTYHKVGNKEILEGDYKGQNYKSKNPGSYNGKVRLEKVANSYFYKEDFIIKREKELAKQREQTEQNIPKTIVVKPTPPKKIPVTTFKPKKNTPRSIVKKAMLTPQIPNQAPVAAVQKKPLIIPEISIVKTPIKISVPIELPTVLKERRNELYKTIPVTANEIEVSFYDNGEIDGDTISVYLNGKQIVAHRGLTALPITVNIKIDSSNPDQEIIMVAENLGTIPPNTALMIVKVGGKRYDINLSSNEQKNAMVKFRLQKE